MTKLETIDGLKVYDARKPIEITITAADVRSGVNKRPDSCAAACAIKRLPVCQEARVHISRVYIKVDGKWLRYATPTPLRREIVAFDRGGRFEPGTYKLIPLYKSDRSGYRKQRANNTAKKGRGKAPMRRIKPAIAGIRERMSLD